MEFKKQGLTSQLKPSNEGKRFFNSVNTPQKPSSEFFGNACVKNSCTAVRCSRVVSKSCGNMKQLLELASKIYKTKSIFDRGASES